MATEVELRFVHVDVAKLQQRLEAAGAAFLSSVTLREVRFAGLSGSAAEYVRARDDGRLVRLQHKAHDAAGHGAVERELPLNPETTLEAAVDFLAGLGLTRQRCIERRRIQWALGPAIVSIDQFPRIPPHAEVEAEALADVHAACARLGLDPANHAGNSLAVIYRHYGIALDAGDIVFTEEERRAFPPPRFAQGEDPATPSER